MPSSPNQKMKLLYLMKILHEETDEEHMLTIREIIDRLAEYGVSAERKALYADMDSLRFWGLDIETCRTKTVSYYLGARDFELPELKLLVDAVQSSRFISSRKSAELIRKLSALASRHQAKQLNRKLHVTDWPKTANESVYYSIDAIHAAINEKKKICFRYFDYDIDKNRVYRKGGALYCHTPVVLCWSDDSYYLICYHAGYDAFTHYRVDRMSDVTVCKEAAVEFKKERFNLAAHMKQTFGMFAGEMVQATLRFDSGLIKVILDRFGADITLQKDGDGFIVVASVAASPVFLGWLFQFGDQAEILAPEALRESMRTMIEQNRRNYGD